MMASVKLHKKLFFILFAVIFISLGAFAFLELSGRTSFILDRGKKTVIDTTSKTTSKDRSAQSDFTGGKDKVAETSNNKTSADVNDTKGAGVQATASASTSSDGLVTVYSPGKNSIVMNGSSLTGKTSGQQVSFRIIDNISGVISTGQLAVVNGNFSAVLNFSTSATAGRIDIFQTRPDLTEYSVVEIPVRFK